MYRSHYSTFFQLTNAQPAKYVGVQVYLPSCEIPKSVPVKAVCSVPSSETCRLEAALHIDTLEGFAVFMCQMDVKNGSALPLPCLPA